METTELLRRLDDLAHLEHDAASVYAEALPCVKVAEIAEDLQYFMDDHVRHAELLAATIRMLGGRLPEERFDAVGRFLHWATVPHARPCCKGALEALEAAEHYHELRYRAVTEWDVGDRDIAAMLAAFAEDERRHQEYVMSRLATVAER
jgi:rubrerythrin